MDSRWIYNQRPATEAEQRLISGVLGGSIDAMNWIISIKRLTRFIGSIGAIILAYDLEAGAGIGLLTRWILAIIGASAAFSAGTLLLALRFQPLKQLHRDALKWLGQLHWDSTGCFVESATLQPLAVARIEDRSVVSPRICFRIEERKAIIIRPVDGLPVIEGFSENISNTEIEIIRLPHSGLIIRLIGSGEAMDFSSILAETADSGDRAPGEPFEIDWDAFLAGKVKI